MIFRMFLFAASLIIFMGFTFVLVMEFGNKNNKKANKTNDKSKNKFK